MEIDNNLVTGRGFTVQTAADLKEIKERMPEMARVWVRKGRGELLSGLARELGIDMTVVENPYVDPYTLMVEVAA